MNTPKQIKARKRNWSLMKLAGMVTETSRISWFCNNTNVIKKAITTIKALKELQEAVINSTTNDWK